MDFFEKLVDWFRSVQSTYLKRLGIEPRLLRLVYLQECSLIEDFIVFSTFVLMNETDADIIENSRKHFSTASPHLSSVLTFCPP